ARGPAPEALSISASLGGSGCRPPREGRQFADFSWPILRAVQIDLNRDLARLFVAGLGGRCRPPTRTHPEPTIPNQNQGLAAQRSSTMWPLTRMMATRTQPKSLSASRRKRRPGLECLEEKQLLSITFGAYSSGTYAFDSGGAGFRQIDTVPPTAMKEGADGTLFAVYDNGTYQYDYGSNHWSKLTSGKASALSAARDNTLSASYGDGTWEFNGSWHKVDTAVATNLAAVSNNNVYASFSSGTWHFDGTWHHIDPEVPTAIDASSDGALFGTYHDGTWEYTTGWRRVTGARFSELAAVSNTEVYGTNSLGTYDVRNGLETKISVNQADHLGNDGATLIGSYGGSVAGTWIYENGSWRRITTAQASLVD